MQPILMLAIVGIAAIGLGTGFLNNNFAVMVQQFGIGEGDVTTPIDKATVDFQITAIPQADGTFKNVIDVCKVTLDVENAFGDPQGTKPSELWCKLTDMNGNIIAEGKLLSLVFPADTYMIPVVPTPDVRDVDDVIVIAHANTYSTFGP